MKVLLNIAVENVASAGEWAECEGIKLTERADGSFDLLVTRDLATSRSAEASAAEFVRKLTGS